MKSLYFTSKQIGVQSAAFLTSLGLHLEPEIDLERPALLVLDMQNYFFSPDSHAFIPSAPAILPGVVNLITAFQQASLPVIFTRHENTEENAGHDGRMVARPADKAITPRPDWSMRSMTWLMRSSKRASTTPFTKPRCWNDCKPLDVTDLVITGVMTHLCCETTARSGFVHGFRIWFPVDGTATYNMDFHLATLRNLSHGFATPVLIKNVIGALA